MFTHNTISNNKAGMSRNKNTNYVSAVFHKKANSSILKSYDINTEGTA